MEESCQTQYHDYLANVAPKYHLSGTITPVIDCILNHLGETTKSNMAAAAVVLGLLPTRLYKKPGLVKLGISPRGTLRLGGPYGLNSVDVSAETGTALSPFSIGSLSALYRPSRGRDLPARRGSATPR